MQLEYLEVRGGRAPRGVGSGKEGKGREDRVKGGVVNRRVKERETEHCTRALRGWNLHLSADDIFSPS